jgi:hypothetical protein
MDQIITRLKELTGKKEVFLVNRGNTAIKIALKILKTKGIRKILIPDEGGWITYRQFPKKLGFTTEEIKTENGLIKPFKMNAEEGLLYQSLAGYHSEQLIKEIYESKNDGMIILDVCDLTTKRELSADIVVGSFGRAKVVNSEYGGFIAVNDSEMSLVIKEELLEQQKWEYDPSKKEELLEKLNLAEERLKKLNELSEKVKKDLSQRFEILNKEIRGINVIVKCSTEEKQKVIKYCKEHKYEWTECPKYIRSNIKGISIELKRLK